MVRASVITHKFPAIVTHCSNNFGPHQHHEKLIPLAITKALAGETIPVYGDGMNVRDWLYVGDHCRALIDVALRGRLGDVYNIGGGMELSTFDVVTSLCTMLGRIRPGPDYDALIKHVQDRPGHDRRYAIDASKIRNELGWLPTANFASALFETVKWYVERHK
jgi:dTDP-glucose 4,6-dehydratase